MKNAKFTMLYLTPFRPAVAPQGGLRSINLQGQKVLRIKFQGGSILCKSAKFQKFYLTPLEQHVSGAIVPQGDLRPKNDI